MSIDDIIFDGSGTLADSEKVSARVIQALAELRRLIHKG